MMRRALFGLVVLTSLLGGCSSNAPSPEEVEFGKSYRRAVIRHGDLDNDGLLSLEEERTLRILAVKQKFNGITENGFGGYIAYDSEGNKLTENQVRQAVIDYSK